MESWIDDEASTPGVEVLNGAEQSMQVSLGQRKRDMIKRCTEMAQRYGRTILFGMTTALVLQGVPVPSDCSLDLSLLHTVSSTCEKRMRVRGVQAHIWKYVPSANIRKINAYVAVPDLFHVWAQLSVHISLKSLVVLGDAIITAVANQPNLAQGRDAVTIHRDLAKFVSKCGRFKGRSLCLLALALIVPGVDSPMESEERIALRTHGIPLPQVGYTVPDVIFKSGAAITLDMAWPEHKVAVEYDGDQHRTNQRQWRSDREKRDKLTGHQWIIFVATASNLSSEGARAEFAFNVARVLAKRGAVFNFFVVAQSVEQLAKEQSRSF